jgi:hypothetical protein
MRIILATRGNRQADERAGRVWDAMKALNVALASCCPGAIGVVDGHDIVVLAPASDRRSSPSTDPSRLILESLTSGHGTSEWIVLVGDVCRELSQ